MYPVCACGCGVSSCLTQLKTRELLMELPSKRLLLRLVETRGKYLLPAELHAHFRVPKDHQDTVRRQLGHARWSRVVWHVRIT